VRHLVQVDPLALRVAFGGALRVRRRNAVVARIALALPGGSGLLPGGVVLRRPGAQPLARWLTEPPERSALIVSRSWRTTGSLVVRRIGAGGETVAKLAPSAEREHDALALLGATAAAAGAAVPGLVGRVELRGIPGFVATAVPGRPVEDLLLHNRDRVPDVIALVAGWLARWNEATAHRRPLTDADVERHLLAPAGRIGASEGYGRFLAALGARALGADVPFVAAHNDLTCSNLLVDGPRIGVLDWEEATAEGLPLADLVYAGADAVAAADGYADRATAWAASEPLVQPRVDEIAERLGLSPAFAELCIHACWLRHAANEAEADAGDARPFAAIVRRLQERVA
jgi:aminoglycoside phosphotransferase (APT) family kinase protein